MRALIAIGLSAIGIGGMAGAASAQAVKSVRTAQLISTTSVPAEPVAADHPQLGLPAGKLVLPASAETGSPPEAFRVHDLSRRWVAYQMASALAAEQSRATSDEDPFAPIGVAQPQVAGFSSGVAPASSIAVPAWMRGGRLFAAAAATYVPGCATTDYRPSGLLASDAEYRRRGYYGLMSNIACQYGIPVGLFDAMIIRESRYNAAIYSPKNAFGLTQLMPGTAEGLGVDRYDVEQNLRGGARYLREQLDRFGQYHLALAAYNAGPSRVRNGRVPRIVETQDYVSNILLNWSKLSGLAQSSPPLVPRSADRAAIARGAVVTSF